ncbi:MULTISPECIES: hypothetical protein [Bacillus]|uniref:hypothetical protein n=1 Tax=Bacillus TaxID=1386 RepID=UPI000BB8BB00|nr:MULTISPECIES: hypothetical protein [Bacillus]
MDLFMVLIAIYATPFLCLILVLNSVTLAKKIKKGDENTASNTTWIAVSFTLITYSLVWVALVQ